MSTIHLNLPSGAIVKGSLQAHYQPEDLDQEILEVDLPSGLTIDVGWYPQFDENGSFQIVVYRNYWENRVSGIAFAKTPTQVANLLRLIAEFYSQVTPVTLMSDSKVEYTKSFGVSRQFEAYANA